jgi:hypothetical protein
MNKRRFEVPKPNNLIKLVLHIITETLDDSNFKQERENNLEVEGPPYW